MSQLRSSIESALERIARHKLVEGAVLCAQERQNGKAACAAVGNIEESSPYFIASTTKLYTSAMILMLAEEGKLELERCASDYLPLEELRGLQCYGGGDYAELIKVHQLLAHTSGIPDYFMGKVNGSPSLETLLKRGQDQGWSYEEALERARTISAGFAPGERGRALYSDSNYQLLGRIIERLDERSYAESLRVRIVDKLGLEKTYLYQDPDDRGPVPLRFKRAELHIPLAMCSFGPDGGIVSTARESLRFVRAFFEGELFEPSRLPSLQRWNAIMFPLEAGVGMTRFKAPWLMAPFGERPELIGQSGLSGAFAFFCPDKGVYLAGTVNQIHRPDLAFRLMMQTLAGL